MRKATTIGLALTLAVLHASCASSTSVKSGAAAGEALIKLLPKGSMGVMAVDMYRALTTEAATKALPREYIRKYRLTMPPSLLFLDAQGTLLWRTDGDLDYDKILAKLKEFGV